MWVIIFLKWKAFLDALVNQDSEYAVDGQARKLEDKHIWKPPVFLQFASTLQILDEYSSSNSCSAA